MPYLIHTKYGHVKSVYKGIMEPPVESGFMVTEISEADLAGLPPTIIVYVDPETHIAKVSEQIEIRVSRPFIINDGIDTVTIFDIPAGGCELSINNELFYTEEETKTFTSNTSTVGALPVYAVGRYLSPTIYILSDSFENIKQEYIKRLKETNLQKQYGGMDTPLGRVQTNEVSISKILLNTQTALSVGESFSVDWKMEDNSIVTHSYADMINLSNSLQQFLNACQTRKNELEAQVLAAPDGDSLFSIDITEGWPS